MAAVGSRTAHLMALKTILQEYVDKGLIDDGEKRSAAQVAISAKVSYPLSRDEVRTAALTVLLEHVLAENASGRAQLEAEKRQLTGGPAPTDPSVAAAPGLPSDQAPDAAGEAVDAAVPRFSLAAFKAHMAEGLAAMRPHDEMPSSGHPADHFVVVVRGLQDAFGDAAAAAARTVKEAITDAIRGVGLTVSTPSFTHTAGSSGEPETVYGGVALVRCTTEQRARTAADRIVAHRWGVGVKPLCEVRRCAGDAEFASMGDEVARAAGSAMLIARDDKSKAAKVPEPPVPAPQGGAASVAPLPPQPAASGVLGVAPSATGSDIYGDLTPAQRKANPLGGVLTKEEFDRLRATGAMNMDLLPVPLSAPIVPGAVPAEQRKRPRDQPPA